MRNPGILLTCVSFLAASVPIASAQTPLASPPVTARASETRLGYTADATVYPPMLNGQAAIVVYRDPSDNRQRRYVKPILIPSWETFSAKVAEACRDQQPETVKTVPLRVEFSSKKLNEEIVKQLNERADPQVRLDQLFSYPIYALFVVSGSKSPNDDIQTKIQFRYPSGISDALPRGVNAALDQPLLGIGTNPPLRITESCENLTAITETRDIDAYVYTEFAEVKLNAASAVFHAFTQTRAFIELERTETSSGVVSVTSRTGSKGVGFNFGGFLSGSVIEGKTIVDTQDTRRRFVSANVAQQIAEDAVLSGAVYTRSEAPDLISTDSLITALLDFILGQAKLVSATLERRENGQMAIVAGEQLRFLSREETKMVLESAPTLELNLSDHQQVDCSMVAMATNYDTAAATAGSAPPNSGEHGKQCTSERNLGSKYANSIRWQKDGNDWVPTSVDLYAVNTQALKLRAVLGVENAVISASTEAQIHPLQHVTTGEPTDYVADLLKEEIEAVNRRIDGPKKQVIPIPGGLYKTISYWSERRNSVTTFCPPVIEAPGPDFEQIGGNESGENIENRRGCSPANHCDSAGESCNSYNRHPGCFINKDWLAWYIQRKQTTGSAVDNAEICSQPVGLRSSSK